MTKPDIALNLAIGAVAMLFIFFVGYVFGHSDGSAFLDQALSAQQTQTMRDLSKYPLGKPRFFLGPSGLGATCER
jgi:hypothetical protein